jgi:succinate-semialdehyde dehydrogenase/glutarate-semialdehyde dehydrogenase
MDGDQPHTSTALKSYIDSGLLKPHGLIDGQWIGADDGATFGVHDPATGDLLATIPSMGAAETQRAVDSCNAAWPAWRALTAKARSAILRKWFDLIIANTDAIASILTAEQGKPLAEAKGEIAYAASFIEWFAEEGKRISGEMPESPLADKRILVMKQPIGVCAAITPWNFPAAMITRKVGPALAAGCTMLLKPAEQTPLTALALGELALRAGVPPGVFNIVLASDVKAPEVGGVMTGSPIVRKVTFTGSTEVGRILMRQSAGTVKKMSLELGGNAPFIVFDDADLDAAVEGAMASKYRNAGQTCVCANRIYVQSGVYEQFAAKLAEKAGKLKVGRGTEAGVEQGPLIDEAAVRKVEEHIADALAHGAKVLLGGKKLTGRFFQPTVLTGVTSAMKVAREETFGPVAPLFRFDHEAEAVKAANDTEFGLASYFYSNDIGRIFRVSEALEYGIVGVNTGIISNEVGPFGGVKQSGLGREGSIHGIDDFLELKYVCLGQMQARP